MTPRKRAVFTLLSSSPRRREIVSAFNGRVEVAASRGTEPRPLDRESPHDYVVRCAVAKLGTGPFDSDATSLVSADTVVALDGEILGKPESDEHARSMLRSLRNRRHDVVTGVAVLGPAAGRTVTGSESSAVLTRNYSDEDIEEYIARREPFDKAGGYAVQDGDFAPVSNVEGCYLNVVGLPLCLLLGLLREVGAEAKLRPLNEVPYYDRCIDCKLRIDLEAAP